MGPLMFTRVRVNTGEHHGLYIRSLATLFTYTDGLDPAVNLTLTFNLPFG